MNKFYADKSTAETYVDPNEIVESAEKNNADTAEHVEQTVDLLSCVRLSQNAP